MPPKKRRILRLRYIIPTSIIILVALFISFGGLGSIKDEIERNKIAKEVGQGIEQLEKLVAVQKAIFVSDEYGGRTPRETLDMFISALENDDIGLAVKYFALDRKTMNRDKWEDRFKTFKEKGDIPYIVEKLKKAEVSKAQPGYDSAFQFAVMGSDGMIDLTIYMILNEQSRVWKIEKM